MIKIFNIDWLQFSGNLHPENWNENKIVENFKIEKLNFGTKHFKTIYEVFDLRQNKKVATVVLNPHSSAISKILCIVKIENWLLYQNYVMNYIIEFLEVFNIKFKNLTRVDICCDFNLLDYRNQYPAKFIEKFLKGDYIKLRRSKGQVYFEQQKKLNFQYLKFGTGNSRICTYIYNKTKELEQVKNKPHIRESWKQNNLSGEIWRCEFRIQNFDFLLTDIETGQQINYNGNIAGLNSFDIIFNCETVFKALSDHYLVFKIKGNDTNKSRLKGFKLFNTNEITIFKKVYNDNPESGRSEKIFIKKLVELNDVLRGTEHDIGLYANSLLIKIINATELNEWAKNKNLI